MNISRTKIYFDMRFFANASYWSLDYWFKIWRTKNFVKIENREKPLKNGHFHTLWMIQIFPGKTAVHVSCPHSSELPCKISRKSLEPFSRKIGNQPTTNYQLLRDWFYGTFANAGPKLTIEEELSDELITLLVPDSTPDCPKIRVFGKINPILKIAPGWQITEEHRSGAPTKSWYSQTKFPLQTVQK